MAKYIIEMDTEGLVTVNKEGGTPVEVRRPQLRKIIALVERGDEIGVDEVLKFMG